jgi:uncharacterized membrane-anchored protein YitT (DUF2179 family)
VANNVPNKWSIDYLITPHRYPRLTYGIRILVLLIGCFLGAVSVNSFLVPAHILAGGVTGVAQIIHHYTNWPIGSLYFIFNVPLFILGYKYLGKQFVILTAIGIVAFSFFTDWVHIQFDLPLNDPLLVGLYGGVLAGLSSGLIIRVGGSAGGTDILSLVIHRISGKSVGSLSFFFNAVIVVCSMGVFGVPAGMYTLVSMFATSRVINALMHYQNRKTALIVSAKAQEISKAIAQQIHRGSTLLNASGTYTNSSVGVLMCALTHFELAELKWICTSVDPNVFITVLDTTEVVGRFRNLPV